MQGTGVSSGIGLAKAAIWPDIANFDFVPRKSSRPAAELKRLKNASQRVLDKTAELRSKTSRQFGESSAAIFDVYTMMLEDDDALIQPLRHKILNESASAEYAVISRFEELAEQFLSLDDEYMRQRVDDVFGLRDQLMRELMGMQRIDLSHLERPTVIVAHNLSPADMANLDLSRLEGIVCETGGYSSHLSIIARTLRVPAVMAVDGALASVKDGQLVGLDGDTGEVWVAPHGPDISILRRRGDKAAERQADAQRYRGRPTITTDGHRVELSANVGQLMEVDAALEADAEALGLFRTEMLHLEESDLPSEDAQFETYRAMLEKLNGKAATVRTFDDGGNRPVLPIKRKNEENPVLGFRGIRMSLGRPSFFRTQLRALLRASAYGSLRVMFPMVSGLDELNDALAALAHIKDELRREGTPFDEKMPVGVDIEVPASALMSGEIAKRVDFLSIGINDLIQFTLAIDRGNPDLAYMFHHYHPAVLRLVQYTVDECHAQGKPCVLSGDAPGHEQVLPVMLGMGMDGFSLNPGLILRSRQLLNNSSYAECKKLAEEVVAMTSVGDVMRRLNAQQPAFP